MIPIIRSYTKEGKKKTMLYSLYYSECIYLLYDGFIIKCLSI